MRYLAAIGWLTAINVCLAAAKTVTVSINTAICSTPSSVLLPSNFSPVINSNLTSFNPTYSPTIFSSSRPDFSPSISQLPGDGGLSSSSSSNISFGGSTSSSALTRFSDHPGISSSLRSTGTVASNNDISTSTTPSASPTSSLPRFLISFRTSAREDAPTSGYLRRNGTADTDCKTSASFALKEGVLSVVGAKQDGAIYSVDLGVASAPFVPSYTAGAISTKWVYNGTLSWENAAFRGGNARFCEFEDGTIEAYFTSDPPISCNEITFSVQALTVCPGYQGDDPAVSLSTSSFPSGGLFTNSSYTRSSTSTPFSFTFSAETQTSSASSNKEVSPSPSSSRSSSEVASGKSSASATSEIKSSASATSNTKSSLSSSSRSSLGTSARGTGSNGTSSVGTSPRPSGTSLNPVADPQCQNLGEWNYFYSGRYYTLEDDNLSDGSHPKSLIADDDPDNNPDCYVISACVAYCANKNYQTMELYYTSNDDKWNCVCYYKYTADPTLFSTRNTRVSKAFGYSHYIAPPPDPIQVPDPNCATSPWTLFFYGSQRKLDDGSPANAEERSSQSSIADVAEGDNCQAISRCLTIASDRNWGTIDVRYGYTTGWTCYAYSGSTNDASYYVSDTSTEKAFGYSRTIPDPGPLQDPGCAGLGGFENFYNGRRTLLQDNSKPLSDSTHPQGAEAYTKSTTDCGAVIQCAFSTKQKGYKTFTVQYDEDNEYWYCYQFFKYTKDTSYFRAGSAPGYAKLYAYSFPTPVTNPNCGNIGAYDIFYFGRQHALVDDNQDLSDGTHPAALNLVLTSTTDCDAVSQCYNAASTTGYRTFNVVYNDQSDQWTCRTFFKYTDDQKYFASTDTNIAKSYAYSLPDITSVSDPGCTDIESWTIFYYGSGRILVDALHTLDDGANTGKTKNIDPSKPTCSAVSDCQAEAQSSSYKTFNVYFSVDTNTWVCNYWAKYTQATDLFQDKGSKFSPSYAYSLPDAPTPPAPQDPQCNAIGDFSTFFVGDKKTLQSGNEADIDPQGHPAMTQVLSTANSDCSAVQACYSIAKTNGYHTFNVFCQQSINQWTCVAYYGYTKKRSEVSGNDADITKSYAYTQPIEDPLCSNIGTYTIFYHGDSSVISQTAAINDPVNHPGFDGPLSAATSDCDAIQQCYVKASQNELQTFNVWYQDSTDGWYCRTFYGYTSSSFAGTGDGVENADFLRSFAYSYQTPPPPTVNDPRCSGLLPFTNFFHDNYKIIPESAAINGDSNHLGSSSVIPPASDDCDAITSCKDKAVAGGYHTFNVYYDNGVKSFICNSFYGYTSDVSVVSETKSRVVRSYAYSYPQLDDSLTNPNCANLGNFAFFFAAKRATLEPGNAADNDNSKAPVVQQYDAASECDAVETCVRYANAVSYHTFDVYYSTAAARWICKAYAGFTADPAQLTTGQDGIFQSYAYSYSEAQPQPPVGDPACGETGDWAIFYHDRGHVLDGNRLSPQEPSPWVKITSTADSTCQVLDDCIAYAQAHTGYTINLLHLVADSSWRCAVYNAYIVDGTLFSKVDSDAAQSYGYSRQLPQSPPTIDDPQCNNVEQYSLFHHGYGKKMDDTNAANTDAQKPPSDQSFSNYPKTSICDAIGACKDVAKAPKYHTFEVYYITGGQLDGWACRAYSGFTTDESYFSVAQTGTLNAYGYSLSLDIDPNPPQTCNSFGFTQFFDGRGAFMATTNPANTYSSKPPLQETYPLSTTECNAVLTCAASTSGDGYHTFDLHRTTTQWVCVEYYGYTLDPSTFSEPDDTITRSLGYSLPKPAAAAVDDPSCNQGPWVNFFHGRGQVLSNDNAASSADFDPKASTISNLQEDQICSAVDACRTFAETSNYHTFNVFWTNYQWICQVWQGYTNDDTKFISSAGVEESYAYSREIAPVTSPNCPPYNRVGWTNFYAGSFKDPTSIGTMGFPSEQTTFSGNIARCDAIQSCIDYAESRSYSTFSLRYDSSVPRWICIADRARNHDDGRFSVPDAYAPEVYGFYFPLQTVTDPNCGALSPPSWQNFYYGSQLSMNPLNPANSDSSYPAVTSQLNGVNAEDTCGAVQACISFVETGNYRTLDVHFDDQLRHWQCFGYHGRDGDPGEFNQPNEKLIASYGYVKNVETSDPNCGSSLNFGFTIFYHGSEHRATTSSNPADPYPNVYGPISTTFPATQARCLAIQNCINYANAQDYSTFDIYYDYSIEKWTCQAFYGTTTDQAVYSGTADPSIEQAYGYSRPQPSITDPCGPERGFIFFGGGRQKTIDINSGIQSGKAIRVTTFTIDTPQCDAIRSCALFTDEHHYHTFNVRQDSVTNRWQCGAYYGSTTDPSIFSISDANIIKDIGYSKSTTATPSCTGSAGSFKLIFSGNGRALVSGNSANDDGQVRTNTFPPQYDICQVVSGCSTDTDNNGYGTFQVIFIDDATNPLWMCFQYHGLVADASQVTDVQAKYDMSLVFTAISDPNCKSNGLSTDFNQFYFGYSKYMPDANLANPYSATYPSKSTNFGSRTRNDQCNAISDCLAYTASQGYSTSDISYNTANGWQCTAFYGSTSDPTVFSQTSTTIRGAYGWSRPLAPITQPSCSSGSYPSVSKFSYFYGGRNKVVDPSGSSNDRAPYSQNFASSYTDCQALDSCGTLALSHRYATWEVNLNGASATWTCNAYHGFTSDASIFSVSNTQIVKSYGYSAAVSSSTTCDAGSVFFQYYAGSGKRLPVSNPANDQPGTYPPVNQNIDPTLALCDAVQVCKSKLQAQSSAYATFEVVFVDDPTSPYWKCAIYHATLTDATAVTDTNAAYGLGVGYSSLAPCPVTGFTEFFRGFGYQLNQSNPAATDGAEVRSEEYPYGDYNSCSAAAKCRDGCNYFNYHTFDIHADITNQRWRCVFYKGETTDFNYAIASGQPNAPSRFYSTKITDPKCNTQWTLFFSGNGKTLSASNPANSDPATHEPKYQTNVRTRFTSECDAINGCRQYAQSNGYHTFELHVVAADSSWSCSAYYGELADTDTVYFVTDASAGNVYGYHTGNTY